MNFATTDEIFPGNCWCPLKTEKNICNTNDEDFHSKLTFFDEKFIDVQYKVHDK